MKFAVPFLSLALIACSHSSVETSTTRTSSNVMPATYAMASPEMMAPNQQRLTSSDCAKGFDSEISYLEYLMEKEKTR